MKYIKLFEGFFDRDFGDRLWTETDDWVEWQTTAENEQPEKLKREEIFDIVQKFRYNDTVNIFDSRLPWTILSYTIAKSFSKDVDNSRISMTLITNGNVIIHKFVDDRWMIEIFQNRNNFQDAKFFCDSYEGLINWIEDWREKIN